MKPIFINVKSLQPILGKLGKKVKQWKYYLPILNLALFIGVISLAVICVLLVYYPPVATTKSEKNQTETPLQYSALPPIAVDARPMDAYEAIAAHNPFSPTRSQWNPQQTQQPKIEPKNTTTEDNEKPSAQKQISKGTPAKVALQGIMIIGNERKALIENPNKTNSGKPFVFVSEGEEIAEYKVKKIESDQIILDWYGEEIIIAMRSNIKK